MSPHERIYSYQFEGSNFSLHLKDKNQTRRWWGWFPSSLLHRLEPAPCSPPRCGIVISSSPHKNTMQNIVRALSRKLILVDPFEAKTSKFTWAATTSGRRHPEVSAGTQQPRPAATSLEHWSWSFGAQITITMAVTTTTKNFWQQQTIVVTTTNNSCDNNKKRTISPALTAASRMVIAWSGNSSRSHNAHLHPGLLHLFRKDLKVLQGIFRKLN